MEPMNLCRRYLAAINSSSLTDVLALFESPYAPVRSSAHGQVPVSSYFPSLFGSSEQSIIRIRHVFEAFSPRPSIALHYHYTRIGNDGQVSEFDGVDIFDLNESGKKFEGLTVIYDPTKASVRARNKFHGMDASDPSAMLDETRYYNFELNFDLPLHEA